LLQKISYLLQEIHFLAETGSAISFTGADGIIYLTLRAAFCRLLNVSIRASCSAGEKLSESVLTIASKYCSFSRNRQLFLLIFWLFNVSS